MKTITILDTETNGLDLTQSQCIELGYVRWSVEHRCMQSCRSVLLDRKSNEAQSVNGIAPELLRFGVSDREAISVLAEALFDSDAIVAHNAEFDRQALGPLLDAQVELPPWICTLEDFIWPEPSDSQSLVNIALAHGVAVVSAHRAIHDCLLLARLLERLGSDVDSALAVALKRAQRPKAKFVSLEPFARKDEVKAAGFRWDNDRRVWWKRMAIEDAAELPFRMRREDESPINQQRFAGIEP